MVFQLGGMIDRILHGRMAYTGHRLFEGCYHAHEDFDSRLRVVRGQSVPDTD